MTDVRITQLDGKLPNFALMRLSAFHKAQGDAVRFSRSPYRQLGEPAYDAVYGSAVFDTTRTLVTRFRSEFPDAVVGGTAVDPKGTLTVESIIGDFAGVDYDHWPKFTGSIGFSQRGCRFACGFCGVPGKEGKPKPVATIADLWRGEPWPRHIHLLDNDFFGQPKPVWKAKLAEIRSGGFKVCFNQGVNIRVITDEIAAELAATEFRDDAFKRRRLYTAWDSLGDEDLFFRGVDRLEGAGIRASALMVYMLIGFDPAETWAAIFRRFNRMKERKIKPYIMVFEDQRRLMPLGGYNHAVGHQRLMDFERWVNSGLYRAKPAIPFAEYNVSKKGRPDMRQITLPGTA